MWSLTEEKKRREGTSYYTYHDSKSTMAFWKLCSGRARHIYGWRLVGLFVTLPVKKKGLLVKVGLVTVTLAIAIISSPNRTLDWGRYYLLYKGCLFLTLIMIVCVVDCEYAHGPCSLWQSIAVTKSCGDQSEQVWFAGGLKLANSSGWHLITRPLEGFSRIYRQ